MFHSRTKPMSKRDVQRLYDAHSVAVFRFACAMLRDREAGGEVLQDVFVKRGRNRAVLSGVTDVRGFVLRTTRNTVIDRMRRAGVRRKPSDIVPVAPLEPDAAAAGMVFRDAVALALAELPVEQREVVAMKLWEGRTFAEIGDACGVSQNTAASRYRYGIDKLRGLLRPLYDEL